MVKEFEGREILHATKCTGYTCKARGNCFSVDTEEGKYRIVNFRWEEWVDIQKHGVDLPIKILPISDHQAIIQDERIPDEWYEDNWCEVCCPENLLPVQQRLRIEREIAQGVRTELDGAIIIAPGKRPKLHWEE